MRQEAEEMAMKDPDYSIRDLYNSIAGGYYPSYTLYEKLLETLSINSSFHIFYST